MIGLDTAKSVFQIHGVNESGKVELKRKLHRSELIAFFQKHESCTVARIAWAVMTRKEVYRPKGGFAVAAQAAT